MPAGALLLLSGVAISDQGVVFLRRTLRELRAIAGAIGYSVVEATEPGTYYLLRRIDRSTYAAPELNLGVPPRAKFTLEELARVLGLTIEKYAATVIADVRKNYLHAMEVTWDQRIADVITIVHHHTRGRRPTGPRTALDVARELHELARDLCRRPGPR